MNSASSSMLTGGKRSSERMVEALPCRMMERARQNKNSKQDPAHLKGSEGLVVVSNWARGTVALVAFKPSGGIA